MGISHEGLPNIKQLREAIPKHCFRPSNLRSFVYIVQDVSLSIGLSILASRISLLENALIRWCLWGVYGVVQGMIMTGIWILAHECGHQALFTTRVANDTFGFVLHSMLLVPYFSWKYSHGLHHRYANHMEKDTAFVPYRKSEESSRTKTAIFEALDVAEDTPALNLALLVLHQLIGFPAYLLFNISAGINSLQQSDRGNSVRQSHFDPYSDYFTSSQHAYILLSDLGLAATFTALYKLSELVGVWNVVLLYAIPYLWVNHWIVAITYLHHTHPSAKHFEKEDWNFRDGALSTVDRDFGFIGKHVFHGIIEFHVIHHLFAKIPFYHAEEATESIIGLLGEQYLRSSEPFLKDLWQTWVSCRYVESSPEAKGVLVWARN